MSGVDIAGLVFEWRDAMSGVTPGPWYSESVATEGSYGSGEDTTEGFDSYVVRTEAQKSYGEDAVICDALNSGTAEVHEEFDEDGTHAWDEPGRCNMEWIARCSPSGISALLDALSEATRQRDEALAALKASEERVERLSQELASARFRPEPSSVPADAIKPLKWDTDPLGNMMAVAACGWATVEGRSDGRWRWSLGGVAAGTERRKEDAVKMLTASYETRVRSALENDPTALADATNNPPSDPGTEQREAGRD